MEQNKISFPESSNRDTNPFNQADILKQSQSYNEAYFNDDQIEDDFDEKVDDSGQNMDHLDAFAQEDDQSSQQLQFRNIEYDLASMNIVQELQSHRRDFIIEGRGSSQIPMSEDIRNQFYSSRTGQQDGAQESDNSDNEYELCFVVQDVEFLTYKNGFIVHSQYFRDLLNNVHDQQIRILLPLWATADSFRLVLDYVNVGEIQPDVNLETIQNVLWLADFFQIHQLQKLCIDLFIVPQLTRINVLNFLEDAFQKLSSCQEQQAKLQQDNQEDMQSLRFEEQFQQFIWAEDIWYEFFNQCLDVTAQNIDFIIKSQEKEILNLPDSVVEEIIERSLKICGKTEDNELVKFMMKMKKVVSPFDLLEQEKQRVITTYEKLVHTKSNYSDPMMSANVNSNSIKPLLTWKLSNLNLKQNFYKESDPFTVDGNQWILYISKMNDKECCVGIKFQSIFESDYESQQISFNVSQKSKYMRYSILSLLNWIRIDTEPSLLTQSSKLIKVYFQLKHTVSAILSYISLNFGMLSRDQKLPYLSANEFQLILMHRKINVKNEDEVIDAFASWLSYNILNSSKLSSNRTGNSVTKIDEKEILEIMKQINWPYVSFDKLMDLFKNFQILRQNIHIKSLFNNEFRNRATKKQNEVAVPPRMSYDSVMIETLFDYKYFLDKVADFLFKNFDAQSAIQQAQFQSPTRPHYQVKQIGIRSPSSSKQKIQNQQVLKDQASESSNYQKMNKNFLEEQYYSKLKELNQIKSELHKRQISADKNKVHTNLTNSLDMNNQGSSQRNNILSPSTNDGQISKINQNNPQFLSAQRSKHSSQQRSSPNKSRSRQETAIQNRGLFIKQGAQRSQQSAQTQNNNFNDLDQQKILQNHHKSTFDNRKPSNNQQKQQLNPRSQSKKKKTTSKEDTYKSGEIGIKSSAEFREGQYRLQHQAQNSVNKYNRSRKYLENNQDLQISNIQVQNSSQNENSDTQQQMMMSPHIVERNLQIQTQNQALLNNSMSQKQSSKGSQRYLDLRDDEDFDDRFGHHPIKIYSKQYQHQNNQNMDIEELQDHLLKNVQIRALNQQYQEYPQNNQIRNLYQLDLEDNNDEENEEEETETKLLINRYTGDEEDEKQQEHQYLDQLYHMNQQISREQMKTISSQYNENQLGTEYVHTHETQIRNQQLAPNYIGKNGGYQIDLLNHLNQQQHIQQHHHQRNEARLSLNQQFSEKKMTPVQKKFLNNLNTSHLN
ncbi:UNKNOWN [Stylonychia lemnae]|uniref:BTB domain-containing protein n=1 Tax=Stylonychia lemnae TaxID=5949 RepID=A0A078A414_STYLE|nr:UNKNOWN [Stylonychia lemnae]|eukprot:CDW77013.1 UNKNOWN [Stylonychia lemnae]